MQAPGGSLALGNMPVTLDRAAGALLNPRICAVLHDKQKIGNEETADAPQEVHTDVLIWGAALDWNQ